MIETPVLISGAGPTGMSLAFGLSRHGLRSLLIDKAPVTTTHPRARGNNVRTMEIFRLWGLEQAMIERIGTVPRGGTGMRLCESITGRVGGVTFHAPASSESPTTGLGVVQDVTERVLAEAMMASGHVEMRRGVELVDFEQHEGGVTARIRDITSDDVETVKAQYLIGADGAGSRIRKELGIAMEGKATLLWLNSYYYQADVGDLPQVQAGGIIEVMPTDPTVPRGCLLGSPSDPTRWLFLEYPESFPWEPENIVKPPVRTEEDLVRIVRAHWGIPDLNVEFLSFQRFHVGGRVAQSFGGGRIILAGDAAHPVVSAGGLGLNAGVQDAHNLAWKLAMVLKGVASDRLLETYEQERKYVAGLYLDWSVSNLLKRRPNWIRAWYKRDEDPDGWRAALLDLSRWSMSEGHALGFIYPEGALIDDGSRFPPHDAEHYWPSDRPGARFPHVWLDAEWTTSTLDWFDTSFVLVCGSEADEWEKVGQAVAEAGPYPLDVRRLPSMAGYFGFGPDEAVLVRPDGHVAWRPGAVDGDKQTALEEALAAVTGRATAPAPA